MAFERRATGDAFQLTLSANSTDVDQDLKQAAADVHSD